MNNEYIEWIMKYEEVLQNATYEKKAEKPSIQWREDKALR